MSVSSAESGLIAVIPLGMAWAASTVNTVIFRHHGVLSHAGLQFTAFYVDACTLRLLRRNLATDEIETFDLPAEYRVHDAHNSISLGVDNDGKLHLAYAHHASAMRYRRAERAFAIDAWSEERAMTGQHESQVTYPAFVKLPDHGALLMLYRDGTHQAGAARLKRYDEADGSWGDIHSEILSGVGHVPWPSNPYWNTPVADSQGGLHLAFVWRTHVTEPDMRITNVDIDYAYSPDGGETWLSSRGRPFRLPVTQVNSETILGVAPGSNLINQSGMAVDGSGHPHIVFYSDDPDGVPQYQHLWFDGRQWRHAYLSNRTVPFLLSGKGTLEIPISRPAVVIDSDDRVYVIYRSDSTGQKLVAQRMCPPNYEVHQSEMKVLWHEPLGYAEPVIDSQRWRDEGVLSMLIQKNYQVSNDKPTEAVFEPIYLVDWNPALLWDTAEVASPVLTV